MKNVLLISMPFSTITYPSLGISLLKARLAEEGIDCAVKYFSIDFAAMIGFDLYERICIFPLLGERLFLNRISANESAAKLDTKITLGSCTKIENLDTLPYPDYDDYFEQIETAAFPTSICRLLPMETSRGCWWGSKAQCRFCGLSRRSLPFRSKNVGNVIREIARNREKYIDKYGIPTLFMVDNILDKTYLDTLLPTLKKMRPSKYIFFDIKPTPQKKHVQSLAQAGITWVQPGIESLNSRVLKLMSKGLTSIANIQFLKFCRQFGVWPSWYLLTDIPGEKIEDYQQMVSIIYKIVHMAPPAGHGPFTLQRFSPYFRNPQASGITNVRPKGDYEYIYPFEAASRHNLAYYFDFDYIEGKCPQRDDYELTAALDYWRHCYENNQILTSVSDSPHVLRIEDYRSATYTSCIHLEGIQKEIYEYCEQAHNLSSIHSAVSEIFTRYALRTRDIRDFLAQMLDLGLMLEESGKYLSLAIPHSPQLL